MFARIKKRIKEFLKDILREEIEKEIDSKRFAKLHCEKNKHAYIFGGNDYFSEDSISEARIIIGKHSQKESLIKKPYIK